MSDILLKVEKLETWLGDGDRPVRAVDGVDLTIRKGETFALLGESGCGKSMTALSIMRLLPPVGRIKGGQVLLGKTSLLDLPEYAMREERGGRMAMIFQEPMTSLNPVLTIGQQIGEAVRIREGADKKTRDQRIIELLNSVGIPDPARRVHEYPHQLSGGMKQRVMIAMALAGHPELLIADEPTTALDVTIQAQVLTLLKELQQKTGMAILLITHDLGVVSEVADRVAVMYAGQIIEVADAKRFFQQPQHPYSEKLFQSLPDSNKRTQRLAVIKGTVPALNQTFTACRFMDRCHRAFEACHQAPGWTQLQSDEGVRCHLAGQAAHWLPDQKQVQSQQPVDEVGRQSPLLDVKDLKVHFPIHKGIFKRIVGHVKAVDGVSLAIAPGKTLALVGESGCGKTTVGKGILQLLKPTAGLVAFESDELTQLSAQALRKRRADLQIIFQDPMASMNPRMLVGDIIEEGMRAQGVARSSTQRRERTLQLLEQVGLPEDSASRYPHEFSGGQRQRICVARALAVDPKLIICDEPTSALDVSVQAQILNLLKSLQQSRGLAYLFITHNISVVAYLADEVAVMYLGRIVERGAVEQLLTEPKHPYTQALLSAVPLVDSEAKRAVIRLEGDMPSPANPPAGCHFHPRCPVAMAECQKAYPELRALPDGRFVSCFKVQEGL
ncbi:MAG: ABC transporter ATP-binding protein [Sedimenticola sp.]|nr:ABC transporter ATP-binding protein [Sedimenticola sp.]